MVTPSLTACRPPCHYAHLPARGISVGQSVESRRLAQHER